MRSIATTMTALISPNIPAFQSPRYQHQPLSAILPARSTGDGDAPRLSLSEVCNFGSKIHEKRFHNVDACCGWDVLPFWFRMREKMTIGRSFGEEEDFVCPWTKQSKEQREQTLVYVSYRGSWMKGLIIYRLGSLGQRSARTFIKTSALTQNWPLKNATGITASLRIRAFCKYHPHSLPIQTVMGQVTMLN